MKSLVLVPTYKKSIDEIKALYNFLNIKSEAVFANQCGRTENVELFLNGHRVLIICSDTIGVSINRNILLKNASGDINIFIDDDCPLVDHYEAIVQDFYNKYSAECCVFNGIWETHNSKLIHYKKTKRIKYFNSISYAGGPGFTCSSEFLSKNKVMYNEKIGTPNYICAGEDSYFYLNLVKSKTKLYRSSDVIFKVAIDQTNSSYFNGINEQYIVTRGYITKLIHPYLFFIYKFRHALRFKRQGCELKMLEIIKLLNKGSKLCKEGEQ